MRRWAALAGLVVVVAVGACGSSGDRAQTRQTSAPAESRASVTQDVQAQTSKAVAGSGGGDAASDDSGVNTQVLAQAAPTGLPAGLDQSKIVKTATLQVEVDKGQFSRVFSRVATLASSLGGFVASSTSASGSKDDAAAGTLVLRIPSTKFDDARAQLRKLGDLKSEDLSGEDVGGQLTDIEARLRNLRAQEEAIRALMSKARDVNETLTVQNQLSSVRQQIEQLVAQQSRLNDSVAYSTITVGVAEPGAALNPSENAIARAWRQAVQGAQNVIAGAIVVAGYLLPLALIALVAFVIARAAWRARTPHESVAVASAPAEHGS